MTSSPGFSSCSTQSMAAMPEAKAKAVLAVFEGGQGVLQWVRVGLWVREYS